RPRPRTRRLLPPAKKADQSLHVTRPRRWPGSHQRHADTQNERGTTTMAKLSSDDLLEAFKEMTLIELSEFVTQFEDTFDVKAAAPGAVAAAPGAAGGGAAAEEVEEK